jgi:hypothetical protein
MVRHLAGLVGALALGCGQAAEPGPAVLEQAPPEQGSIFTGDPPAQFANPSIRLAPRTDACLPASHPGLHFGPDGRLRGWGLQAPARLVLRDRASWQGVWTEAWTEQRPSPDDHPCLPEVDFENEMLVLAALGYRSHGGYQIDLEPLPSSAESLALQVTETRPGEACFVTTAPVSPYVALKVPTSEAPAHFVEEVTFLNCG